MTTDNDSDAIARMLADQLEKQSEICLGIKRLSERQQALVSERREDELLRLLSDKQELLNRHQDLFAKTQVMRDKWDGVRNLASPESQAAVEGAWERLKTVLNEVVALEDASRGLLQEQQNRLSMDIGKVQRGKIANKAYGGSQRPPVQATYSDKQG